MAASSETRSTIAGTRLLMLLDSNIIIYASQPAYAELREFITANTPAVSIVSYVEVLGFHRLDAADRQFLEDFFDAAEILPITDAIADQAVRLRQQRRMSLGDALIAATALIHQFTLVTRNCGDFEWIAELDMLNPVPAS
jgi:toxin FitB